MGCTSAIVFTCFGAAYGTAKSGVGISAMGVLRPDLIVRSMLALMKEAEKRADMQKQTLFQLLWLVSLVFTASLSRS